MHLPCAAPNDRLCAR
jgi:hypothetical protein